METRYGVHNDVSVQGHTTSRNSQQGNVYGPFNQYHAGTINYYIPYQAISPPDVQDINILRESSVRSRSLVQAQDDAAIIASRGVSDHFIRAQDNTLDERQPSPIVREVFPDVASGDIGARRVESASDLATQYSLSAESLAEENLTEFVEDVRMFNKLKDHMLERGATQSAPIDPPLSVLEPCGPPSGTVVESVHQASSPVSAIALSRSKEFLQLAKSAGRVAVKMMSRNSLSKRDTTAEPWEPGPCSMQASERFKKFYMSQGPICDLLTTIVRRRRLTYDLDLLLDLGENRFQRHLIPDNFLESKPGFQSLVYQLFRFTPSAPNGQTLIIQSSPHTNTAITRLQAQQLKEVHELDRPDTLDSHLGQCSGALSYIKGKKAIHIHRERPAVRPTYVGSFLERVACYPAWTHPVWLGDRHRVVRRIVQGLTMLYPIIASDRGFLNPVDFVFWKAGQVCKPWANDGGPNDWETLTLRLKVHQDDVSLQQGRQPLYDMWCFRWYLGTIIYGFATGKMERLDRITSVTVAELRRQAFNDISRVAQAMHSSQVGELVRELLSERHGDRNVDLRSIHEPNLQALATASTLLFDLERDTVKWAEINQISQRKTRNKQHIGPSY